MIKKEKHLYQGEKSNFEFYSCYLRDFYFSLFKRRIFGKIILLLIAFSLVFSLLDLIGIVTWNQLFTFSHFVDGVKPGESSFSVYFLDVGQSDCTIIECENEVLLIDTGTKNQVYTIRKSLYTLEIDTIDYMVVTHQHDDHMSGASELIEHYNVSNIMMPKLSDVNLVDSLTYKNLIKTMSEYNVNPIAIESGYSFNVGSALVEVLAPIKQDKELNNMSVVLKVTYGDTSFLFQGDSEQKIENQLLNLEYDISADVIKVGHHGSNTSSSEKYLNAVNPDYAIVSCGPDNNYGHPSYPIIDRLEEKGITTYVTSVHGNVTVISDGKKISFTTEKQ